MVVHAFKPSLEAEAETSEDQTSRGYTVRLETKTKDDSEMLGLFCVKVKNPGFT